MAATPPTPDPPPLTAREDRFVLEYLGEPNATRAYLRAYARRGYAPAYDTARSEGAKLLAKPRISAAVAAGRRGWKRHLRVTAARVLRELAAIAFADPIDAWVYDEDTGQDWPLPLRDMPADHRRAIASRKVTRRRLPDGSEVVTVEVKYVDKLAALDRLCKHLGLTKDGAALDALLEMLRDRDTGAAPAVAEAAPTAAGDGTGP